MLISAAGRCIHDVARFFKIDIFVFGLNGCGILFIGENMVFSVKFWSRSRNGSTCFFDVASAMQIIHKTLI